MKNRKIVCAVFLAAATVLCVTACSAQAKESGGQDSHAAVEDTAKESESDPGPGSDTKENPPKEADGQQPAEADGQQFMETDDQLSTEVDDQLPTQEEADGVETQDPTLGGLFALYTPEEYEAVIDNIKKYGDGPNSEVVKRMEEDLERLKADGGKGEFVIYKPAFEMTWEEGGYSMKSGFDPTIVMAPHLVHRNTELTAESYRQDIAEVEQAMKKFMEEGRVTSQQRDAILNKMEENLKSLE